MTPPTLLALAVVLAGLAGRSALDKLLALRGGAELVSQWAQLTSIMELVAGVSVSGLGLGLSVLVVQTADVAARQALYREALKAGMVISLVAMILLALGAALHPQALGGSGIPAWWLVLGAVAGWVTVLPSMVNAYWQGLQQRHKMLALALLSALAALIAAWAAASPWLVAALLFAHALPVLVLLAERPGHGVLPQDLRRRLWRFLLPGLSIGILSPASMLAARNLISQELSWHDAGVLQALWRLQEWVGGIAAGLLSVYFLPRLAAARGSAAWPRELRHTAFWILLPSALALAGLAALQEPLLAILYAAEFKVGSNEAWLFFIGGLLRIAAWVPLFGLYAQHRTRSIAWTELLSLPLFVALLALQGSSLTLGRICACWLAAYLVYAAINTALLLGLRGKQPAA